MGWDLFQAFFLFGLVLALAWLSTRLVGAKMGLSMRGRLVRVLEHVPAGRDRSVMLLEVGGKLYLVGATPEQIRLLDRIEDAAVIERVMAQVEPQAETPLGAVLPGNFKDLLQKLRGAGPAEPGEAPLDTAAGDEIKRLEQQLERLRRLQQK